MARSPFNVAGITGFFIRSDYCHRRAGGTPATKHLLPPIDHVYPKWKLVSIAEFEKCLKDFKEANNHLLRVAI